MDIYFLTIVDIEKRFNVIITEEEKLRALLGEMLDITFTNGIARREDVIIRKTIGLLLDKALRPS